jgi:thiosulfate/3-mercaptopyruvate sulfurtransferase
MTDPIVSAQWLAEHLNDSEIAIADCRFALMDPHLGRNQYEAGHIPNAYYLDLNQDLSSPVKKHGGRHPLPDPRKLAAKLSTMGITSSTFLVAYDDSRFAFAARLWWLLKYLGHDHVAVLDGGFSNWQTAGYPITSIVPEPKSGNFVSHPCEERVVDISTVNAKKELPNVALIDSREPERYRAEQEPIDPVAGHIPGAVNYPWQEVTTDQGFLRSPEELRAHFGSLRSDRWHSLESKDELLVYCGSGVTACVNLLALTATGINTGKLYAGSWSDWCSYLKNSS